MMEHRIIQGDVLDGLRSLPDGCVQTVITSPPYYGLRDYSGCSCSMVKSSADPSSTLNGGGNCTKSHLRTPDPNCKQCGGTGKITGTEKQIGLEETPEKFVQKIVEVFREVRRVLRDDGTVWLNIGDSYSGSMSTTGAVVNKNSLSAGSGQDEGYREKPIGIVPGLKPKDMIGIPWRVAFALQADGWYLRSDIIWAKPNPMPESVSDRCTKSHEYIFLLTKSARYFYDADAIREDAAEPCGWDNSRAKGKNYNHTDGWFKEAQSGRGLSNWQRKELPKKQDQTGNPTYTGFNERWKQRKDSVEDYPGSPMYRGGTHNSGLAEGCGNGITRNARTVWTIPTQARPEAHFATFPDEIPRRCIKAGTSEYGCCPKCGAPWERVVEKESPPMEVFTKTKVVSDEGDYLYTPRKDGIKVGAGQKCQNWRNEHPAITTGWQPGCTCDAGEPAPCVVLDPFIGSGTVAVVARELNRSSIGIELNPTYIKIIRKRLQADSQLDTGVVSYRFETVKKHIS